MSNDETKVIGKHAGRILKLMDDIRAELRTDSISLEIRVASKSAGNPPAAGFRASHTAAHKELN
jgi:hypothetical protein